jgi:hypothetical protein
MTAATFVPPTRTAEPAPEQQPVWLRVISNLAVWSMMPALALLMLGVVPDHALAGFLEAAGIASRGPFDIVGLVTFIDRHCSPWFAGISGALPHDTVHQFASTHQAAITDMYLVSTIAASVSFALFALDSAILTSRPRAGMDTICWAA